MADKRTFLALACAGVLAAGAAAAADEVISAKAKLAFTPPSADWTVRTDLAPMIVATLVDKYLNARITINYTDYELYDFKVDYGFLKGQLEKNEKNSFKFTKPNYDRVSLTDRKFGFGKAARLEFTSMDEVGYRHAVVYAIANGTIVYFFSVESQEREWLEVEKDFEILVSSIRFTP